MRWNFFLENITSCVDFVYAINFVRKKMEKLLFLPQYKYYEIHVCGTVETNISTNGTIEKQYKLKKNKLVRTSVRIILLSGRNDFP